MVIKKIEEMDFYDLLGLPIDALPEEIEKAYSRALATYQDDALASYGVLSSEERKLILARIKAAFAMLSDTQRRKAYDALILPMRPESKQRAYFRKTTTRLEIEDASEEEKFWAKARLFFSFRKRKRAPDNDGHKETI